MVTKRVVDTNAKPITDFGLPDFGILTSSYIEENETGVQTEAYFFYRRKYIKIGMDKFNVNVIN